MTTAAELDSADPLAEYATRFIPSDDVVAYLDGKLARAADRRDRRTIRLLPDERLGITADPIVGRAMVRAAPELGDRIAAAALGAASGQTLVGDSTTVLLYKLSRPAIGARPGRSEIVVDTDNFPTDRFVLEGIAAECGMTVRWITPDPSLA